MVRTKHVGTTQASNTRPNDSNTHDGATHRQYDSDAAAGTLSHTDDRDCFVEVRRSPGTEKVVPVQIGRASA